MADSASALSISRAQSFRGTVTHPPMTNILDLTPETLARIAALVSERSQCRIAGLPFQIECTTEAWKRLRRMRLTCRALRDACYLAVASVRPRFRPWRNSHRSEAALVSSVLSFPCLVELHVGYIEKEFSNAAIDLLQRLTNLKRLVVCYGTDRSDDVCARITSFPSSRTLKELKFVRSHRKLEDTIANLLSFPFHSLSRLEFLGGYEISPLPEHVLKMLKTFTINKVWHRSAWKRGFLLRLTRAPLLRDLHLTGSYYADLSALEAEARFCSLRVLSLKHNNAQHWKDVKHVVDAAVDGCFPKLEKLIVKLKISCYEDDCLLFPLLRPMLVACRLSLKLLDVILPVLVKKEDVDMLNSLNMRQDFELRFTAVSPSRRIQKYSSFDCVSLRDANFLTSINFKGWLLNNIDRLSRLRKLRAVRFVGCIVQRDEIPKLKKLPGNLKYIELSSGRLPSVKEREKIDPRYCWREYFRWNALTQEEHSELVESR